VTDSLTDSLTNSLTDSSPDPLKDFIANHRPPLERALAEALPKGVESQAVRLDEALHYAVFPGGKRWRPILTLLGSRLTRASIESGLSAACAVEFLHTSSIILDDLPAMDDAGMRRGRPTIHVVYGESIALLSALALFNESYALLLRAAHAGGTTGGAERLVGEATRSIGARGMIGGQAADLEASHGPSALARRNLKTNALLRLTMTAGAIASGADEFEIGALAEFGECLGTAYQICDDLLDELVASETLGKPARQDARHARPSYVRELGVAGAHRLAVGVVEEGKGALRACFGGRDEVKMLAAAADRIVGGNGRLNEIEALASAG
jgi:geranylgeranyl diphosphate synthase type II